MTTVNIFDIEETFRRILILKTKFQNIMIWNENLILSDVYLSQCGFLKNLEQIAFLEAQVQSHLGWVIFFSNDLNSKFFPVAKRARAQFTILMAQMV